MSFKAPKISTTTTDVPNPEDEAARIAREAEARRSGRGRKSTSLTSLRPSTGPSAASFLPARNVATGN